MNVKLLAVLISLSHYVVYHDQVIFNLKDIFKNVLHLSSQHSL